MYFRTYSAHWSLVLLLLLGVFCANGDTLNYAYAGGVTAINQSADGGNTPGVTDLTIGPITDSYVIPANINSVSVTLTGLNYPYAGDLVFTLSLLDSSDNVLASADLVNRLGKMSSDPNDYGFDTQYGNSYSIDSGNYMFNSGYAGDLWTTAAPLGSSDSIPSGAYRPTTAYSGAVDNLSSAFGGLAVQGATWQLQIYDYGEPGDDQYVPSLENWSVTVDTSVPEPRYSVPFYVAFAVFTGVWLRRNSRRSRTSPAIARMKAGESFNPGTIR